MKALNENCASLSCIMKKDGNIIDDTIITNMGDHVSMIINGAWKHKDWKYFMEYFNKHYSHKDLKL